MSRNLALVNDFVGEAIERLGDVDAAFVDLQNTPDSKKIIQSIFSVFRQIMGMSGYLGFENLEQVAKEGVVVIDSLYQQNISFSAEVSVALFSAVEYIRTELKVVQGAHKESEQDIAPLVEELQACLR